MTWWYFMYRPLKPQPLPPTPVDSVALSAPITVPVTSTDSSEETLATPDDTTKFAIDTLELSTDSLQSWVDTIVEPVADTLEKAPIDIVEESLTDTVVEPVIDTLDETVTDTVVQPVEQLRVVKPEPESKAFIIGGCFGMEEYALNMASAAIEKGCTTAFVMKRGSKFFVAYGQYPTAADAKAALPDIIANYNKKAWILNK